MNIKIIFLFIITAVFSQIFAGVAYAYNPYGISDGLYMKLEEEKSALEYRISQIETNSQSNPGLSALSIQSRINELIVERDSKKSYITGTYAHYGISNQASDALSKIDAEYQSKISDLESQKSLYTSQSITESENSSLNQDIQDLRKELIEIKAELESQKRLELENEIESLKSQNYSYTNNIIVNVPSYIDVFSRLDNMEDYFEAARLFTLVKTDNINLYNQILELAKERYFNNKTTLSDVFGYVDSISSYEDTMLIIEKLGIFEPELSKQVTELARNKYPYGKFEIIKIYNNYSKTPQKIIATTRVESKEGDLYRLSNTVFVPGYTIVNGERIPGSIKNYIYPVEPNSNKRAVDKDEVFKIPGFKGDPKYDAFFITESDDPVIIKNNQIIPKKTDIEEIISPASITESIKSTTTNEIATSTNIPIKIQEKKQSWFRRILNWFGLWKK